MVEHRAVAVATLGVAEAEMVAGTALRAAVGTALRLAELVPLVVVGEVECSCAFSKVQDSERYSQGKKCLKLEVRTTECTSVRI